MLIIRRKAIVLRHKIKNGKETEYAAEEISLKKKFLYTILHRGENALTKIQ